MDKLLPKDERGLDDHFSNIGVVLINSHDILLYNTILLLNTTMCKK